MIRRLAPRLTGILLLAATCAHGQNERVVFEGYDPLWQSTIRVVNRGGTYYMDFERMEELRHPNMPSDGLSLAMTNRIGRPSMYWVILPRKIDVYIGCEFGACTYKRSIIGTCCEAP